MNDFYLMEGWGRYKPTNFDDLLPWTIFDRYKFGVSIPLIGTHPIRTNPLVAWHTPPTGQNYHTLNYRLKKSICENDINEFSLAISENPNLDRPVSHFNRYSMLTLACKFNHDEIAKQLILRGANLEVKDRTGATPLLHAVCNSNFDCIKLLVESGADLMQTDDFGMSALKLAKSKNLDAIYKFLESKIKSNGIPKLVEFELKFEMLRVLEEKRIVLENLKPSFFDKPVAYPFNNVKGTYLVSFKNMR